MNRHLCSVREFHSVESLLKPGICKVPFSEEFLERARLLMRDSENNLEFQNEARVSIHLIIAFSCLLIGIFTAIVILDQFLSHGQLQHVRLVETTFHKFIKSTSSSDIALVDQSAAEKQFSRKLNSNGNGDFSVLSDSLCTICLDRFNMQSNDSCKLGCDHEFHSICIEEWTQYQSSSPCCPLCRCRIKSVHNSTS
mmetsp:Transcript_21526/g.21650  ORF Transcript_21526/g.21650 Transcript_21526/m.21650 type:complete len:196 (+) Transcript_21526:83-670(+)